MRFVDVNGEGPGDRVKAARAMTGAKYAQETGSLRTGTYSQALSFKDCSGFVNRVLAADGITKGISDQNTSSMKSFFGNKKKFTNSKMPQVGDVALWNGHVGIVSAVKKDGAFKLIHARGRNKLAQENPNYTTADVYRDSEFYGFYKPINETPDGKIDGEAENEQVNQNNYISDKRELKVELANSYYLTDDYLNLLRFIMKVRAQTERPTSQQIIEEKRPQNLSQ